MAQINITTTMEEQQLVLQAVRELQGKVVPMTAIAKVAGLNPNRVRYIVADLLEAGKIKREAAKAYNKHYIRYIYEVVE